MENNEPNSNDETTLYLAGDVMTGRGIDHILPHPGEATIHEPHVKSARGYVEIAEKTNGPISYPVDFSYIWGEALRELERRSPDCRLINLETAVTDYGSPWKGKQIHYRMHPYNVPCLSAAKIDICVLANNHVLDWDYNGLLQTCDTLDKSGILYAGAGRNEKEASAPAVFDVPDKGRVLVYAFGLESSGISPDWAAGKSGVGKTKPGINLLSDLSEKRVNKVKAKVEAAKKPGDIVIASIHWGGNWGYKIPADHRRFAHALIDDAEVDLVHGHSSHHALGIEAYREKLVLYGCGDFLNDYEGIGGHEQYRDDLPLMYLPELDPTDGTLTSLTIVPFHIHHFRLNHAQENDIEWVERMLDREGNRLGTSVSRSGKRELTLEW